MSAAAQVSDFSLDWDKAGARDRLTLSHTMPADFAREHAEWARLVYLEIWPSVFVSETDLRHSVDDFARVVLYLLRQGARDGDGPAGQDPFQTASLLMGGVNQVIITWLLYRRPRNLTKASIEIVERMLDMIASEKTTG